MCHVVQTKYIDAKEKIPWGDKEEKKFVQKKFLAKLDLL